MKKAVSEKQIVKSDNNVMKDSRHAMDPRLRSLPSRVVIDRVLPSLDGGRFAAKAFIDEEFKITAHLLIDGHEQIKGRVKIRRASDEAAVVLPLLAQRNDEWTAHFQPQKLGRHFYVVEAAADRFGTWRSDILKKLQAEQIVSVELLAGVQLLQSWLELEAQPTPAEQKNLNQVIARLQTWSKSSGNPPLLELKALLEEATLTNLAFSVFDELSSVQIEKEIPFQVEPAIARFSSWYEFFPRSLVGTANSLTAERHGSFKDAEARLDYVKKLGFNVLYFPPIHPIGHSFRKGKNNTLTPDGQDVGSPWAIGSEAGGHREILPALGTFQDFESLVKKARALEIEIALDMAFQCSPDHPYVHEHPEWFHKRADGSIQYAENPPKKYQDIYPFDFESSDWQNLWDELLGVVNFWVSKGVRIFRVDNPHTKPFRFWEWLIASVKSENPEVIFLAEAFTRPKIMAQLAKLGFTQSYSYFTWRNLKWEITQYLTELTQTEMVDYYGANFWPNTPDILPEALQKPNRTMYMQRLVLAATLSSNYGIYGPAFELMQYQPLKAGGEEYLDSEKYQLRTWNTQAPESLAPFIKRINEIRLKNKALQQNRTLKFHPVSNDQLIAYSKTSGDEKILVVVNLDAEHVQSGMVELPLIDWKIDPNEHFEVHDLLTDARYYWTGWRNFVELSPNTPAHIFRVHAKTFSLPGQAT